MRKVLLAVLMVGAWSRVDAAVLCTPKSGQGSVSVRTECKKNEVQLDPAALGLQGPVGAQGQKGDKGDAGLQGPAGPGAVVRDANGAFVALLLEEHRVIRQGGDFAVRFAVDETGPVETPSHILEYESTNCSGPAFVPVDPTVEQQLVRNGGVRGTTVYYVSGPPVTVTPRSFSTAPVSQQDCPSFSNQWC